MGNRPFLTSEDRRGRVVTTTARNRPRKSSNFIAKAPKVRLSSSSLQKITKNKQQHCLKTACKYETTTNCFQQPRITFPMTKQPLLNILQYHCAISLYFPFCMSLEYYQAAL